MIKKLKTIKRVSLPTLYKNMLCIAFLSAFILVGCTAPASYHRQEVQDDTGDKVTVGTVQKEIRKGMSGAEVAISLGSPNIVSTDEKGREVWIYDKIATDRVFSSSSRAGLKFLTPGKAGATSTSQRTLTIIIKFDEQKMVRDFAYHTSRF
jgi:outer membrane protein assembly factor BamE (lipoprotein component of BamABCDE complex)